MLQEEKNTKFLIKVSNPVNLIHFAIDILYSARCLPNPLVPVGVSNLGKWGKRTKRRATDFKDNSLKIKAGAI